MTPRGPFAVAGRAEVIAHRGFSARAPENTLAALRAAIEARADAFEFDLHPARDGTPVLFHDETLERTSSGYGRVDAHEAAELAALDAGSWFDPAFEGEPVPTLAEALHLLRDRPGRVYAEIKAHRGDDDDTDHPDFDKGSASAFVLALVLIGLGVVLMFALVKWT